MQVEERAAGDHHPVAAHRAGEGAAAARQLTRLEPAFAWAGTFGDTKDGLPYIGCLPASPRTLYMLCYGANGTNFGMIGANLARDWVEGKGNRDAKLFALDR